MIKHVIWFVVITLIVSIISPLVTEAKARIVAKRVTPVLTTYRGITPVPQATVNLNVPFHRQERNLSCEAATLRMLLLYYGIDESEGAILQKTPFGPVKSDPDEVFVGDVNGRQPTTGYGIHWNGLAKVANQYGEAEAFSNKYLYFLTDRIHDGNPIIIWGSQFKNPKNISWTTPDGKYVRALSGEHVWVVTGYAGPRHAPTHIFTLDPLRGRQIYRTGDFMNIWDDFGTSGMLMKSIRK